MAIDTLTVLAGSDGRYRAKGGGCVREERSGNGDPYASSPLTVTQDDILQVKDGDITLRGKALRLRGTCLGGWST